MTFVTVKLPKRSAVVLEDLVANRLTSVDVVDREDARAINDLVQAQRALQEAELCHEV